MTAGTMLVNGPTENNNGAIDYNGAFEVSGGFIVTAGSAGMAQAPSEQSKQYSIIMNFTTEQNCGTLVHLQDSKGNDVVTFQPEKQYQSVVISSPLLKKDEKYTIYTGGTSTGSNRDGLYTGGQYQSGKKITDFTITKSVTWLSESGETEAGAGGFNRGGFGKGGFRPDGTAPGGTTSPGAIRPGGMAPDGATTPGAFFPRGAAPDGTMPGEMPGNGRRPGGNGRMRPGTDAPGVAPGTAPGAQTQQGTDMQPGIVTQ